MLLHQRVRAQPERVELAPRRRFEQHVGARDERAEPLAVLLPGRRSSTIERLPRLYCQKNSERSGSSPVLVERADAARGAAAGRLDLDDVGAEPGERQPAVLRLLVGELDDADAGERTSAGHGVAGYGLRLPCRLSNRRLAAARGLTTRAGEYILFRWHNAAAQSGSELMRRPSASRSGWGRAYLATTLLAATAFGIFHHGSWGPPHTLAVLTLVALAVDTVAATAPWLGRASPYVPAIVLQAIYLILLVGLVVAGAVAAPSRRP